MVAEQVNEYQNDEYEEGSLGDLGMVDPPMSMADMEMRIQQEIISKVTAAAQSLRAEFTNIVQASDDKLNQLKPKWMQSKRPKMPMIQPSKEYWNKR